MRNKREKMAVTVVMAFAAMGLFDGLLAAADTGGLLLRRKDTTPPSAIFNAPRSGGPVTAITITGAARDDVGVSKVEIQIGQGEFKPAILPYPGPGSPYIGFWGGSADPSLFTSTSTITARTTDTSGNVGINAIFVYARRDLYYGTYYLTVWEKKNYVQ